MTVHVYIAPIINITSDYVHIMYRHQFIYTKGKRKIRRRRTEENIRKICNTYVRIYRRRYIIYNCVNLPALAVCYKYLPLLLSLTVCLSSFFFRNVRSATLCPSSLCHTFSVISLFV